MKTLSFCCLAVWLNACSQELESVGEAHSLQGLKRIGFMLYPKPKSASVFMHKVLQNDKLMRNVDKLESQVQKYVKRGGSLNDEVDVYGNTMLNKALRIGKETFATILIKNNADKNQALQALLPPAGSTREISSQDWDEVSCYRGVRR